MIIKRFLTFIFPIQIILHFNIIIFWTLFPSHTLLTLAFLRCIHALLVPNGKIFHRLHWMPVEFRSSKYHSYCINAAYIVWYPSICLTTGLFKSVFLHFGLLWVTTRLPLLFLRSNLKTYIVPFGQALSLSAHFY